MFLPELNMTALIAIQARSDSKRLPGKIYAEIGDKSILEHVYQACQVDVHNIKTKVFVVGHDGDDKLRHFCDKKEIPYYLAKTEENDLTGRYIEVVNHNFCHAFVRITADCPMIKKDMLKHVLLNLTKFDYVTNTFPRTYVDGFDMQGMRHEAFNWYATKYPKEEHLFYELEANYHARDAFLEHYTMHSIVNKDSMIINPYYPGTKVSVDTAEELQRVRRYYERMVKKI